MTSWKYENLFYLTSKKIRLLKIIDQYEVYKKILDLKGDIVECGVFKGASLIRLLTFRDLFENNKKRKVYGFDNFGKFPRPNDGKNLKQDKIFAKSHDKIAGKGISIENLSRYLKNKKINNFKLIKGDILNTLSPFLKKNKKIKIALLHLDVDIYKPTYFILEKLYSNVVRGGIILLDDYQHIDGATLAVNDFFKKKNVDIIKISKLGRPSYIVKK